MKFEEYKEGLTKEWEAFRESPAPIILFGAGILGRCVLRALQYLNKEAICFCDNAPSKQGTVLCGLPVLSPDAAIKQFPDSKIYLCLTSQDNVQKVKGQLLQLGFQDICRMDLLYTIYQCRVTGRKIEPGDFVKTLYDSWHNPAAFKVYMAGAIATQKCTLRCRDCSHLIPGFQNPVNYPKETVIKSIRQLAGAVDVIEVLTILGGEALLHPDLIEICREASKIPNIQRIHVLSNGTILPAEECLKKLIGNITYLQLNHYGKLSRNLKNVEKRCRELGLECDIYEEGNEWYPMGGIREPGKTPEEMKEVFESCPLVKGYTEIIAGKFYLCGYAACAAELGYGSREDYVDLMEAVGTDERRLAIQRLFRRSYLHACDICGFDFSSRVARAVQIDGSRKEREHASF